MPTIVYVDPISLIVQRAYIEGKPVRLTPESIAKVSAEASSTYARQALSSPAA